MISKLAVTLAYLSSFSLAVVIVDTKPFDEPGYQNIQRYVNTKCPKGQHWSQSANGCIPNR